MPGPEETGPVPSSAVRGGGGLVSTAGTGGSVQGGQSQSPGRGKALH